MEKAYSDYELNQTANRIIKRVDDIAKSMSSMMGANSFGSSPNMGNIFQKVGEYPIDFAKEFYRSNINDLRYIKSKVGSFDETYKELSDGVVMTVVGLVKFPVSFARLMTAAGDIKSQKNSPELLKARRNLTEGAQLLSEVAQQDISIEVKTAINSLQNDIKAIEKKLDPSSGCYIATSIYKDYDHPNVLTLRCFRDMYLSKSVAGNAMIRIYYFLSPSMISLFRNKYINYATKFILDYFTKHINKVEYGKSK